MLDREFAFETVTLKPVKSSAYGGSIEGDDVTVDNVSIQLESAYGSQSGEADRKTSIQDVAGYIYMGGGVEIKPKDHVLLPVGYYPREVTVVSVFPLTDHHGIDHLEVGFQ